METIAINGVALEVLRVEGVGDRPRAPIIFLHEGLGSVAMWRDWPMQVCAATGRAGIVYSRHGYGNSDPVPDVRGAGRLEPDYMQREAWEVLPQLLQSLDIRNPVLLGHSDGGSIALLHASRHPVTACIVMAPHVIVEDVSVRSDHSGGLEALPSADVKLTSETANWKEVLQVDPAQVQVNQSVPHVQPADFANEYSTAGSLEFFKQGAFKRHWRLNNSGWRNSF